MRLKKLILHGFKSFADRTEFLFDAPITGVVGPNGCGKSNVVDGFKWVLGEQSAKSLRGDAMLDVIFNGSAARKPGALAEVTLVFENPRGENGQRRLNLDVDEVSVGRRLWRDGTSEYQINNHKSRLKDVRELFMDTGVGVDAYSVIEQGRVAALLEANPEQRRLIFEEAAGISKFKQRKVESLRKLEKVDQNLLRVRDVVEEVEKRLRGVKVQAGRARTYQEHAARLADLRLQHALHEYHTHSAALKTLEASRDDAQFRLDDISGDLARAQNELAEQRQQTETVAQAKQSAEYELVQTRAALTAARQRQQYARQQMQQIVEQLAAVEQDRAALAAKTEQVGAALAAEKVRHAELTQRLAEHRKVIDERQVSFRDGQLQLAALERQVEQAKSAILDLMRKLASTGSRLGAIEIERKNIAQQQQRLEGRQSQIAGELQQLQIRREEMQAKLDQTVETIAQQQRQLEEKRQQATHLGKQITQVGEQLGAAREHRSGLVSRQKVLKDLEARREGVSEGVKSILRQREGKYPMIRGLVADLLRVDVEHAQVIEAALDGRDQLLVTFPDADAATAWAESEAMAELEGRVSVLNVSRLAATAGAGAYAWNKHPYGVRLAQDLVRFDPADAPVAHHLLGCSVVVDDLATALSLHAKGPRGYRYITAAGEVLEADGTLRAGPMTAAMGILSRRSELDAIAQHIAEVDERIVRLSRLLADNNTMARELEEQIGALRNAVYLSNTTKVETTSGLAQNADKQNGLQREQSVIGRETAQLATALERLVEEDRRLAEQRRQLEADQAQRQQEVESVTARQKETAENLRHWSEQLTSARVELGKVQEQQLASGQSLQRQTAAQAELSQQIQRLEQSTQQLASRRSVVEKELAAGVSSETQLDQAQKQHQQMLATKSGQLADLQQRVAGLGKTVEGHRNQREEVELEFHDFQQRAGEEKVRLESIVQRANDELSIDLPQRYEQLNAPVATAEGAEPEQGTATGYQPLLLDWDAVAAEIKELREKIQRLGNVNVDAINEQQELEQRQTFLQTQLDDLVSSKRQLEELIEEINRESSLRFEQTFNAVREHFQGIFRKLFGGGKADIYLESELAEPASTGDAAVDAAGVTSTAPPRASNILEAGIEIIARPPGKQPVTISQLSGGEKTMTCVALLLSIFKSKPSPFCILDEVDAALDEANNLRFNAIVQEFVQSSQFIVITHSKRTMQIAQMLYGVTMQEQGVSKRVSVKFEQVDNHAEAETAAA